MVLGALTSLTLLLPAVASAAPLLTVSPASVSLGERFTVDVRVSEVGDLYAYDFSLAFDPSTLRLLRIGEGSFLSAAGPTFFVAGAIDNTTGTSSFTGGTLLGPSAGASGSGTLASFVFQGIAAGTSGLLFSDVLFLNSVLDEIGVDTRDGAASVVALVPEAETRWLMLLGLGLLLLSNRKWVAGPRLEALNPR